MADNTEGAYDRTKTVQQNVDADFKRVKETFDRDGAQAAYDKLTSESSATALTGASADQQRQYQETMAKQLKDAGILPELSVAFAKQNQGDLTTNGRIDETKLGRKQFESQQGPDRLKDALTSAFADKYRQLKDDPNNYGYVGTRTLDRTLNESRKHAQENSALTEKRTQDKKDFGELVTNPKLFDAMAKDGKITKESLADFEKKFFAPGDDGKKFRDSLGDAAAQQRASQTLDNVKKAFDDPRNQDNKPGSVLNEDSAGLTNWFGKGDSMTRETLAKGLGYTNPDGSADVDGMKKRLPTDVAVQTKPNPEVPSVTDYSNTAQNKGDGPYQVAQRMLGGDQQKFFKNPDQAQSIMTDVLRQPDIWKQDKQGLAHVNADNRDAIAVAIKQREADIAKKTGQPENNDLSNWFSSRYPKLDAPAAPAAPDVQAATDYKASRLGKEGSWGVTNEVVKGQNLPEEARKTLQGILNNKGVTGIDLRSAAANTEVINDKNLEAIRQAVDSSNSAALKAWFTKRYPKH